MFTHSAGKWQVYSLAAPAVVDGALVTCIAETEATSGTSVLQVQVSGIAANLVTALGFAELPVFDAGMETVAVAGRLAGLKGEIQVGGRGRGGDAAGTEEEEDAGKAHDGRC